MSPPSRWPSSAGTAGRHPRQPDRPDRRSRTRRLGRRSRGPEDQPRRGAPETCPDGSAGPPRRHRAPGHARPGGCRRPHPHRAGTPQPARGAVMTPSAVTGTLLHHLVAGSHAEGITTLGVEAAIGHDDCVLLIAEPGPDFTGETWQLPGGPVLPGQTLTDALPPAVAAIALTIDEVTGYLGHPDPAGPETTRACRFTAPGPDPATTRRHPPAGPPPAPGPDTTPP